MSASAPAPFSRGTLIGMLLVGALAFVALLWFLGNGTGGSGNNGGAHVGGQGLNGYAGLARMLEAEGFDVQRQRNRRALETHVGLLILTPPANADGKEIAKVVDAHRYFGPTIVVAPKWLTIGSGAKQAKRGWVQIFATEPPAWKGFADDVNVEIGTEKSPPANGWRLGTRSGKLPDDRQVETGTGKDLVPIVTTGSGMTLAAFLDDDGYYPALNRVAGIDPNFGGEDEEIYPVVLVFEPDLLDNWGLADRDTAMLARELVLAAADDRSQPIVFDMTFNGFGASRNLLTLASFAADEQSLLSVVLAAPAESEDSLAATLRPEQQADGLDRQALLASLQGLAVSADFLASGALVVTVPSTGSAVDQAIGAARAALLIKSRWPTGLVTMATGRGALRGRTAVGEVVDQAARLQTAGAGSGSDQGASGVLLDSLSAKLLDGRFLLSPRRPGAILLGELREADSSRLLLGRPTPCVGRDSELNILEGELSGCIAESEARVTLVTAPPGAGKSRLRHEFLRLLPARHAAVTLLLGRGDILCAGAPYAILKDAVLRLCQISGSESPEQQRQQLQERIGQHLRETDRERIVTFIGELCGVRFPDAGQPMLQLARQDPKLMREHIRRAFLDLLAAEIRHAPLLVVLDDVQWSDELSIGALDELLQTGASSPCCVLAFARPEVREVFPRLWREHKLQEIQLKGLSKRACERLIKQVLGRDVAPEKMARAIEQSAGNALFLEELIRSLSEGDGGDQSETVVAMLQARIGRLEPGARRAVRAAAILGQTFWRGGVEAIVGAGAAGSTESPGDVTAWFSTLVDAELIQRSPRSRLAGETEYLFRHALVRDAAYQLLTAADLQAGHRLAAEFLVRADESDAIVIAEHLERGDDRPAASLWLQRAAVQALDAGDFATALSRVRRAMSYAHDDEARQAMKELELDAFRWQGSLHELARCATEAMQLFPVGSAAWCKAAAEVAVATGAGTGLSILSGQLQTLEESLLGIPVRPDNASAYMQCLARVLTQSSLFFGQGRVTRLFDRMQQAISEAGLASLGVPSDGELTTDYRQLRRTTTRTSSGRPADTVALGCTVLGWAEQAYAFRSSACYELDRALNHFENARRLFLRGGDLRNALAQATDRGFVLVEVGRYREAATWLTDLSAEIDAVGISRIASLARLNLGIAQARLGQHEVALATLHKAYDGFAPGQSHRGLAAAYLALTHALAGRLDEGEHLARRLAERIPEHAVWDCHSTLAQILLWQGRAGEALALVQRDVPARVVLTSSEGGISRQWLVRAEATFALGDRAAAIAELERALGRLHAQANAIADPAIRHSYLHEVRDHARLLQLKTEWQISESPITR